MPAARHLLVGVTLCTSLVGVGARAPQSHRDEAPLLRRALDAPDDPRPQLALASYYYRVLRLPEAEARATAAAESLDRLAQKTRGREDGRRVAGRNAPLPEKVKHVAPVFPPGTTTEGIVVVEYGLRPDGSVRDARVTRSVRGLDRSALDSVRGWQYRIANSDAVRDLVLIARIGFVRSADAATPNALDLASAFIDAKHLDEARATLGAARDSIRTRVAECESEPHKIEPGSAIVPPRKTFDFRPVYPVEARERRVSGMVVIEAVIGRGGRLCSAMVMKSVPGLDEAALESVRRWEYSPTLVGGIAVPVVMAVTVNFTVYGR